MTCSRMASSSAPRFSMSAALRWAVGSVNVRCVHSWRSCRCFLLVDAVQSSMSQAPAAAEMQVWMTTPSPGGGGGDLAGAQIADRASAQGRDAAEADAHPAARGHQHAGGLAGVEQAPVRRRASTVVPVAEKVTVSAVAGGDDGGAEPLGVQLVGDSGCGPVAFEIIEQAGGPARPGVPLGEVGDQVGQIAAVSSMPSVWVWISTRRIWPRAASRRSSPPKITSAGGGRAMHDDDVAMRGPPACCAASPSPG